MKNIQHLLIEIYDIFKNIITNNYDYLFKI
jgi:hypothetical protein